MADTYILRLSRNCYYVCVGLCVVFGIGYFILSMLHISITELSPLPCTLYTVAGLYCPGCGGTRAVNFLLHGQLYQSFVYHPVVPYTGILVLCYMLSHTLSILTKGRVKAMLFRPIYFYIMIGIILVNWIVKDALILVKGIYLMG